VLRISAPTCARHWKDGNDCDRETLIVSFGLHWGSDYVERR
jgi:hypothetical protein